MRRGLPRCHPDFVDTSDAEPLLRPLSLHCVQQADNGRHQHGSGRRPRLPCSCWRERSPRRRGRSVVESLSGERKQKVRIPVVVGHSGSDDDISLQASGFAYALFSGTSSLVSASVLAYNSKTYELSTLVFDSSLSSLIRTPGCDVRTVDGQACFVAMLFSMLLGRKESLPNRSFSRADLTDAMERANIDMEGLMKMLQQHGFSISSLDTHMVHASFLPASHPGPNLDDPSSSPRNENSETGK
ncbi:hypothetical protein BXZ70DRAFT_491302 [Cristinia sonorae]|uniref:Uncharacterized protein n=1 Tax=Cristinia sonorae TaxID=1940300 RepID=A0A8K0XLK1_9AGAR|nr:hypothetical protein BXZ70DRAFT_491302 [Cristinia sonorae]